MLNHSHVCGKSISNRQESVLNMFLRLAFILANHSDRKEKEMKERGKKGTNEQANKRASKQASKQTQTQETKQESEQKSLQRFVHILRC